jgi:FtsZ-binding cell division protein ZapB
MVTIEQVELLESKVSKAIDYVKRLSAENARLREDASRFEAEKSALHGSLKGCQTRIAELEVLLQGFKKDQERIEQGIISALERLNHFEDAVGGGPVSNAVTVEEVPSMPQPLAPVTEPVTEIEITGIADSAFRFGDAVGAEDGADREFVLDEVPESDGTAVNSDALDVLDGSEYDADDDDFLEILKNEDNSASLPSDFTEGRDGAAEPAREKIAAESELDIF